MRKSNVLRISQNKELIIPPEIVKKMKWKEGDKIVYFIDDDTLILAKTLSFREAKRRVQNILSKKDEKKNNMKILTQTDLAEIASAWQQVPLLIIANAENHKLIIADLYKICENLFATVTELGVIATFGSLTLEEILDWYERNGLIERYFDFEKGEIAKATESGIKAAHKFAKNIKNTFEKYFNGINTLKEIYEEI